MINNLIGDQASRTLERSMDASNIRQQLLSQNLANANTPYYKRLDIDFSSVLEDQVAKNELEMARTHPKHIGNSVPQVGGPRITRETKTLERYDQNNIDVEYEAAQLAENSLFFQSLTASWRQQMSRVKQAIEGR